ncbi:MAG: EamA family transporter [Chloroflexi bacterium]|nr:EamA family transporter [Chloroflexota bacterium]
MSWINIAIMSALVLATANTLDSHIMGKRLRDLRLYVVLPAGLHLVYGLLLLYFFPLPSGAGWMLLAPIAAGLIRAIGVASMMSTMMREEISRIIPIVFTYPVFVAIMAVPLLGERLSALQWLAIIIVASGAVLVSARKSPSGSTAWLGKVFLALLLVSLLFATADVTSKYALAIFSPLNLIAFNELLFAGTFWAISLRPDTIRKLGTMQRRRSTIPLIMLTHTLAPTGILLLLWAMSLGPVSLVSTISGSRPIFVALLALLLSRLAPGFLMWSPRMAALRVAATVMIVAGISIIYLT